jgi:hypothetical protein
MCDEQQSCWAAAVIRLQRWRMKRGGHEDIREMAQVGGLQLQSRTSNSLGAASDPSGAKITLRLVRVFFSIPTAELTA